VKRPHRRAASSGGEGFTLVEVIVVITMVGVLAAVALVFVKPGSAAATSRGYADEVAALCDAARQRAVASRTVQRIVIEADRVVHSQATTTGLAPLPGEDDFEFADIHTLNVPADVLIRALSDRTHVVTNDSVPAAGTGVPGEIRFSPDGRATAGTIFVEDSRTLDRARVAIYRATGSVYAYSEW
jgi:prepilin-type N-terminal cleavage/methylation domain-containing protein